MQSRGHSHVPGRVRVGCSEEKQGEELLMRPKKGEKNSWGRPGNPRRHDAEILQVQRWQPLLHPFFIKRPRLDLSRALFIYLFSATFLPAPQSPCLSVSLSSLLSSDFSSLDVPPFSPFSPHSPSSSFPFFFSFPLSLPLCVRCCPKSEKM